MEYERAEHVSAAPDQVYDVLANPDNLVHVVPQLTRLHMTGRDHVEVVARYDGHEQRGEAWLRSDEQSRRIEWGADGGGYHGSFEVDADGDGSRLVLRLTTIHGNGDLEDDITGTLDAVRRLLEAEV